jgi:c-di-GMP-binding flagellar brake protein YcgR
MERIDPGLPGVNRHVEVRTSTLWLPSRVEDNGNGRLTVAAPSDFRGTILFVSAGEPVAVRWTERRGVGRLDATAVGVRHLPVPVWELRVEGAPLLAQRRRHVRVPVTVVVAGATGDRAWTLMALDLAEGGMLCAAPAAARFEPNEPAAVCLDLEGETLRSLARVVRRSVGPAGATVAFSFTNLSRADADRLRRFLFARQMQRARDLR